MIERYVRPWLEGQGFHLSILWDPTDAQRFLLGLGFTLGLAIASVLLSLVIGVLGVALKSSPWRPVRQAVTAYVELFRNTPLLAQLYFFYFGLGSLLPMVEDADGHTGRMIGNFQWAVIVLGLHSGAFQIEALRGSIDAVPRSTIEAAQALGLHGRKLFRHLILPLALRNSLPALGNSLAQAVKSTSVAYAIAVPELLYACNRIWTDNFNVAEMMQVLLLMYFILLGGCALLMSRIEARFRLPGYHSR